MPAHQQLVPTQFAIQQLILGLHVELQFLTGNGQRQLTGDFCLSPNFLRHRTFVKHRIAPPLLLGPIQGHIGLRQHTVGGRGVTIVNVNTHTGSGQDFLRADLNRASDFRHQSFTKHADFDFIGDVRHDDHKFVTSQAGHHIR